MNTHLAINLAIRSFAPPLLALILALALRKSSASNRRMVWIMCFVVLGGLPLFLLKLPARTLIHEAPAIALPAIKEPFRDASGAARAATKTVSGTPTPGAQRQLPIGISGAMTSGPKVSAADLVLAGAPYALIVWVIGVLLVTLHWLLGLARLSKLRLQPIAEGALVEKLHGACQSVGIRRAPRLSFCEQATAPMVFGHFRPQVVLPAAVTAWSDEALEAVFLHECAHLRRGDWLGLMVSRLLCAVYWFNPLTWLAARQLRDECEAAADDTVLQRGVSAGSYANELLRIAAELGPKPIANSVALVEVGPLRKRIERVLERNRSRSSTPRATIGAALVLSIALSAALGFTYRVVDANNPSHDGLVSVGHGRHIRIIAIVRRTATGTKAWNVHGEPLPNSFPLPDGIDSDEAASPNRRYIVFAHNAGSIGVQDSSGRPLRADPMEAVWSSTPGLGYSVRRVDHDALLVARFESGGASSGSVRCQIWNRGSKKPAGTFAFDDVPMKATSERTASPELDVASLEPQTRTNAPGALIGIADLEHPEWGYWRPDGTPLPPISGVFVPQTGNRAHPLGNVTRQVGLLFRSREGSSDGVGCGDASGVLLAGGWYLFHTPAGLYECAEVFLNPGLRSMQVVSSVPQADREVWQVKLTPTTPSENASKFFAKRMGRPANYFGFDRPIAPAAAGFNRSLRFLEADGSTAQIVSLSSDWDDGVVAVNSEHPEKIVAAKLLEHSYEYFRYDNVALLPNSRRAP